MVFHSRILLADCGPFKSRFSADFMSASRPKPDIQLELLERSAVDPKGTFDRSAKPHLIDFRRRSIYQTMRSLSLDRCAFKRRPPSPLITWARIKTMDARLREKGQLSFRYSTQQTGAPPFLFTGGGGHYWEGHREVPARG